MGKRTRRILREQSKKKLADESEWDFRRRLAGQPPVEKKKKQPKENSNP